MEKEMEKIQSRQPALSCDLHTGQPLMDDACLPSFLNIFRQRRLHAARFLAFLFFLTTASAL